MKPETLLLLEKFHAANRFKFVESDKGLELEHDLSDQEKQDLAKLEYGQTLTGSTDDLFVTIMRKVVRMTVTKLQRELSDRLSDL